MSEEYIKTDIQEISRKLDTIIELLRSQLIGNINHGTYFSTCDHEWMRSTIIIPGLRHSIAGNAGV